jgi:type I restriction enzyme M protein
MQNDGFTLNDNRTPCEGSNIPDILERFANLEKEEGKDRTAQSFFVPIEEIEQNDYDLSINRYKELVYEKVDYGKPEKILEEIEELDKNISKGLKELKEIL